MSSETPIILDLGKKKRKVIKALKRGRGRLVDEVAQTLQEVRMGLSPEEAQGKEFVPIVLIYRRKQKKRRGLGGLL